MRHIDEHKYFQGVPNKNIAVNDFISKYAWIMRETYCLSCPDRKECNYDPSSELYSNRRR